MTLLSTFNVGGVRGWRVGRSGRLANTAVWFFAVDDRVLVDTGCPNQHGVVSRVVQDLRGSLAGALVSHHHEDHAGGSSVVLRAGVPVYAPAASLPLIRRGYSIEYYRRMVWGDMVAAPDIQELPLEPVAPGVGRVTADGLKEHQVLAIHTPGHCPDHHVYLFPEKGILFSADMYVTRTPTICRFDQDPLIEMDSLRRVLALSSDFALCCAHRGFVERGRDALQQRLDFLEELRGRALELKQRGLGARQIQHQLVGYNGFFPWFTSLDFSKTTMIRRLAEFPE